jgi:hypothetical protein
MYALGEIDPRIKDIGKNFKTHYIKTPDIKQAHAQKHT